MFLLGGGVPSGAPFVPQRSSGLCFAQGRFRLRVGLGRALGGFRIRLVRLGLAWVGGGFGV